MVINDAGVFGRVVVAVRIADIHQFRGATSSFVAKAVTVAGLGLDPDATSLPHS